MAKGGISNANGTPVNIRFLLGSQSNLEKYISGTDKSAIPGAFYLTEDTHRLYIGTNDKIVVPVNEGVTTVDSVAALANISNPHVGEFYYATAENILCVYASKTTGWVQINNNTNTYIVESDLTISATAAGDGVQILNKFYYNNDVEVEDAAIKFSLLGADGVKVTSADDKVTITGVSNESFNVTASSNVATVKLNDSFDNSTEFKVQSADTRVSISANADNTGVAIGVADMYNTGVAVDGKAAGGFTVTVSDGKGDVSTSFNPTITVGDSNTAVNFVSGTAALPVYTKSEIDSMKLALNAMTYRGLVDATGTNANVQKWSDVMNSKTIQIGDTFLFATDMTFTLPGATSSVTYPAGSLAIARGTEDANGYITTPIAWDFVEAKNDTDTKYNITTGVTSGTTPGFIRLDSEVYGYQGGDTGQGARINFVDGLETKASVTQSGGATSITFNHESHKAADTPATAFTQGTAVFNKDAAVTSNTVTALAGITVNDQGHVTGFSTRQITLKDSNAVIRSVGMKATTANGASATIQSSVALKDGSGNDMTAVTGNMSLTSNTLSYTANTNGALNIDLVWGSFS